VVLDPAATPILKLRNARAESVEDQLFALMMLGDDRAVRAIMWRELARIRRDYPDDSRTGRMFTVFRPSGKIERGSGSYRHLGQSERRSRGDLATFLGI